MNRKLDDLDVEALRDRFAAGESKTALADAFDVSALHVGRLVAGLEDGPPRLTVDPDATCEAAVNKFLAGVDRDPRDDVRGGNGASACGTARPGRGA